MRHDLCALADLSDTGLEEVEAGGLKILLARDGDRVLATGATCTHKGAPLKKGQRFGNSVVCPWHHAVFDLETGAHRQPPGYGCLNRFETSVENGRVFVEIADGAKMHRPEVEESDRRTGGTRTFAIVGAGAAGLACAMELVKRGFDGRIVLISAEDEPPYDRTDLSKSYLQGKTGDEKLPLVDHDTLETLGIERLTGTVERVDASAKRVLFSKGGPAGGLAFDRCFVAPGSAAAPLDGVDLGLSNVLTLRTHADAKALKAAAAKAERVVLVGSGFIGMEAAAALVQSGKSVTVVAREALPFAKQFGEAVAGEIVGRHRRKGVTVLTRAEFAGLDEENGRAVAVRLKDGAVLPADLVLVAVGARPNASVLSGDEEDRSVSVDAHLMTEDGLHAGGDIAEVPLPGRPEPLRIEHWRVGEQHGRHAAGAMMGDETPFAGVPFFWSAQYSPIRYVGHAKGFDAVQIEGDLEAGDYTAFYVKDGKVVAGLGCGKGDRTAALHVLMMDGTLPDAERLAAAGWDPKTLIA